MVPTIDDRPRVSHNRYRTQVKVTEMSKAKQLLAQVQALREQERQHRETLDRVAEELDQLAKTLEKAAKRNTLTPEEEALLNFPECQE